jgi:hypothetical protein
VKSAYEDSVTMRLTGGLGNQLFILAAGLSIAEVGTLRLRLDVGDLLHDPVRTFELDQFEWPNEIDLGRLRCGDWAAMTPEVIFRNAYRFQKRRRATVADLDEGRDLFSRWNGLVATGYFQDPRWITSRTAALMRHALREPASPSEVFLRSADQLSRLGDYISVHVRRGDYTATGSIHAVLSEDYYQRGLAEIRSRKGAFDLPIVLFTDDVTGEAARLVDATRVLDGTVPLTSAEVMVLMSRGRHCVIANSSFSWWAAFVGEQEGRIVVAPDTWTRVSDVAGCACPSHWTEVAAR